MGNKNKKVSNEIKKSENTCTISDTYKIATARHQSAVTKKERIKKRKK